MGTLTFAQAQDRAVVIRVGLVFEADSCRIGGSGGLEIADEAGQPLGHAPDQVTVTLAPTDGFVVAGHTYAGRALILRPQASGAPVSLNGRSYRGQMVALRSGNDRLNVVNYVDVESYIEGVLAGEVPATWPEESLKAQAVAARSYVLYQVQHHGGRDWDVVATDKDQVYDGIAGEVPSIVRAVRATRGEVLAYDGQIIKAYFCSDCGGHTEDAAAVFGEPAPYLVGVPDPYCGRSPYQQWTREYTADYLRRVLSQGGRTHLGAILDVKAASRDASGRVQDILVVHEFGQETIPATELRRLLGYRDLRSTYFDIHVKKSIPVAVASTHETWADVSHTEAVYLPEQIEIGLDEVKPVSCVARPEDGFYVINGRGALERNRAGYAYAATDEGVLRTFAMRPGLALVGLEHHVTTAKYTVQKKTERVVTSRVRQVKQEVHQQFVPAVLTFSGRGWGHGVGMCQWGARGMAAQGIGYRDILKHYYPATQLMMLTQ